MIVDLTRPGKCIFHTSGGFIARGASQSHYHQTLVFSEQSPPQFTTISRLDIQIHFLLTIKAPSKMAPVVNFITGNANKLREVKAILQDEIEVQSQSLDLEEVQGNLEEVSESKCRRAAESVSSHASVLPCLLHVYSVTTGPRPCSHRRHCALLQCSQGTSRSIHVCCLLRLDQRVFSINSH